VIGEDGVPPYESNLYTISLNVYKRGIKRSYLLVKGDYDIEEKTGHRADCSFAPNPVLREVQREEANTHRFHNECGWRIQGC
jgi:hypothetical protein